MATRREDVPVGVHHFVSVDGSVPGAFQRWDHHVSGEKINLDAMPEEIDATQYDGVGTTLADADAVASVVAVLLGGKEALPSYSLCILESASHWCDLLRAHPKYDDETNRIGRGLLDYVDDRFRTPAHRSADRFAVMCREITDVVQHGKHLPQSDRWPRQLKLAQEALANGRLTEKGDIAIFDVRDDHNVDPLALYYFTRCPVGLMVQDHSQGGLKYTVGVNPTVDSPPTNLLAALTMIAAAEYTKGPPCLAAAPVPGNENWGGRKTVFGSPWNYGSRLSIDQVIELLEQAKNPQTGRFE